MLVKRVKRKVAASSPKSTYKYDMEVHGVTASFIKKWRECRESARLGYVEGWYNPAPNLALQYGTASHWCLQQFYHKGGLPWSTKDVLKLVPAYDAMYRKTRGSGPWLQAETENHEKICGFLEAVLPEYMKRCCRQDRLYNDSKRKWVSLEETFVFKLKVPYLRCFPATTTGAGATWKLDHAEIPIRGRIDGVFEDPKGALWLLESKNLSIIDEDGIMQCLPRDTQSNVYLAALKAKFPDRKIGGVLYNILRRPGLRLGKTETMKEFMARVKKHVIDDVDHYFLRFECAFAKGEIEKYVDDRLKPTVSSMYMWWRELRDRTIRMFHYDNDDALRTKYGYSPHFHAILQNDFSGLRKKGVPFTELED